MIYLYTVRVRINDMFTSIIQLSESAIDYNSLGIDVQNAQLFKGILFACQVRITLVDLSFSERILFDTFKAD